MEYVIAHDLGTSGNKAALVGIDGKVVMDETYPYNAVYFGNGCAEESPADWLEAVITTTRKIVQKVGNQNILAITFSGQMQACVCVDKNGKALRNAIIWSDQRAVEQTEKIAKRVGEENVYRITGHRASPVYTIEKAMWLKENEPELFQKTYRIMGAKDYIIHEMTGRYLTDYSDASGMGVYDINRMEWSEEICRAAGMEKDLFPEVVPSTEIAGEISDEMAQTMGLRKGTKVVVGGGDGSCAAVGAGSVSEGNAYLCMGTSAWIGATTKKPFLDGKMRIINFLHLKEGLYMPCGPTSSCGSVYNWVIGQLYHGEKDVFGKAEQEMKNVRPGAEGLLFLPYLSGERAPIWNPDARGAFVGLSMNHDRGVMMRAATEGISMNLGLILEAFRDFMEISELNLIGGSENDTWRQILSSIMSAGISKVKNNRHATSLGAAMAAVVGLGVYRDFDEIQGFVHTENAVMPNEKDRKTYEGLNRIFVKSYDHLEEIYPQLAAYRENA